MERNRLPIVELLEKNSSDPRIRLELGQEILASFADQVLPSDSTVLTTFVDVMVQWLNGSNFKVPDYFVHVRTQIRKSYV